MSKLWMVVSIVGGVVVVGWMMFRVANSADRMNREPRYRRRWMYYGAAIYGFGLAAGVSQVLNGNAPPATLLSALIPLSFVWFFLRAAKQVKGPPD